MDIAKLRKALLDRETTDAAVQFFIDKAVEEERANIEDTEKLDEYLEWFRFALETYYPLAVERIYEHAESEIEKIFLNSLLLSFIKADPLGLIVVNPYDDAQEGAEQHRERLRRMLEIDEQTKEKVGNKGFLKYIDFCLAEKDINEETHRFLQNEYVFMHELGFYHAFFLCMQAKFPNIKVGQKSIRTDIYIYIPSKEDFNLIVECDGYQFHSGKESFITDRKRDRLLRSNGLDVLRFSGSEIYSNPRDAAVDLFDYLQRIPRNMNDGI